MLYTWCWPSTEGEQYKTSAPKLLAAELLGGKLYLQFFSTRAYSMREPLDITKMSAAQIKLFEEYEEVIGVKTRLVPCFDTVVVDTTNDLVEFRIDFQPGMTEDKNSPAFARAMDEFNRITAKFIGKGAVGVGLMNLHPAINPMYLDAACGRVTALGFVATSKASSSNNHGQIHRTRTQDFRKDNRADQSVLVSERQKALARALLADKATEMGGAMMGATKFVYPQEQALLTAQRNAAKPISEGGLGLRPDNTPAERAAAMGFDTNLLHGGTNDFPAFIANDRRNVYATQSPPIADIYANATGRHLGLRNINAGPNVLPLMSRGKLLEVSDQGPTGGGWSGDNIASALGVEPKRNVVKDVPKHGYAGVKISEMDDLGGRQAQYVFPDPSVLRSRFAVFDPARVNENNLLAGALPFTTMADEDTRNKLMQLLQRNGVPIK